MTRAKHALSRVEGTPSRQGELSGRLALFAPLRLGARNFRTAPKRSTGVAVLVGLLSLVYGCGDPARSAGREGPPPVSVEAATVRRETVRDVVQLVGQLEADESVLIKPETRGVVQSIEFQEGQEVAAGTLLLRLEQDEQEARLRESEAQLRLAEDEYRRAKTLASQGTVSEVELERATTTWQAARARRDLARIELERTNIRAPFDGVLGARLVSPGDRVDVETGLVQIDAVARLRLSFTVPETAVREARVGAAVSIHVAPWPEERFPGEVYFVAPSLDPLSRRLLLKGWVPNRDGKLRPGLFANIDVEIGRRESALTAPESAISYDPQGPFVWTLSPEGTVERTAVQLGTRLPGRVEIVSGLQAGDRIVSAGTHKLGPGAHVQVVASTSAAEEAGQKAVQ